MIERGIARMQRAARQLGGRSGPSVLFLLYHRINNYHQDNVLRADPWALNVTPTNFAEHLQILRDYTHPIPLQQFFQALSEGRLSDRSVVVTFDDGYADNLYNAKPLLEHYDIPATVFLTTGYIGRQREFWWDELEQILLQPGTLPEELSLSIHGSTHQWKLGVATHYSDNTARWRYRWRTRFHTLSSRHRLYHSVWRLLHTLPEAERQKALDKLRVWANVRAVSHSSYRPLSLDEVTVLAHGELIEVGAHTVTHPMLPMLSETSQRDEIFSSKLYLEKILGDQQVTSFSYPHGSLSQTTVSIVREAGFTCACSGFAHVVRPSTDRFALPRVQVQDWNGAKFARWLSTWLPS